VGDWVEQADGRYRLDFEFVLDAAVVALAGPR